MTRRQKPSARRNHLNTIAGIPGALLLRQEKIHIALASDVKAVLIRAAQAALLLMQGQAIQRAAQSGMKTKSH